jgi:hypothetical protein
MTRVAEQQVRALEERWGEIPQRLKELKRTGGKQVSRTDPDSRFLKQGRGFTLGYTLAMAVTEDQLIVEQRVGQETSDNELLLPVADGAMQRCGEWPASVSGDSGFYSDDNLAGLEARGIDGCVPDPYEARELNLGRRGRRRQWKNPEHQRMVQRLRTPQERAVYGRRKAIVEPMFGVLKQQRVLRRFRLRGGSHPGSHGVQFDPHVAHDTAPKDEGRVETPGLTPAGSAKASPRDRFGQRR